ncbi:hypothetical protein [Mycobacterium sp.]|uniref:hypothetical protein n=1 Tax=Mycobacterium sp. TaxID=1785 RepID=UPI0025DDB763|nr:hypothetical protein [Mycobacterium sp.]
MANTGTEEPEQPARLIDKMWHKRAELLWGLAAVILLLTFVSPVVLIGAALLIATVAAGWAGFHELMTRAKQDEARRAVAPVRSVKTDRREPDASSAPAPWHGHHHAA